MIEYDHPRLNQVSSIPDFSHATARQSPRARRFQQRLNFAEPIPFRVL